MSCCLKNYAKKTVVLTPQLPEGAITPLTPLTSELAKLELLIPQNQGTSTLLIMRLTISSLVTLEASAS